MFDMREYMQVAAVGIFQLLLLHFVGTANSAEISTFKSAACNTKLSGEIKKGDADILFKSLQSSDGFAQICLDSPGGDYQEAIRFIEKAKGQSFKTVVPKDARCLSACALIFLAGSDSVEGKLFPWRELHIRGKLGFHGPYVNLPDTTFTRADTEEAYRAGVQAIAKLLSSGTNVLFPKSLLAQALAVGPDKFLYVDTVGKAGAWKIRLTGYKAPAAITRKHVYQACANLDMWQPAHTAMPTIDARPATVAGPNRELVFKGRKSRNVFADFGAEATQHCVAVVTRAGNGFFGLDMKIVDDPKEFDAPGKPMDFSGEAWYSGSASLSAIFPMKTKLSDLTVETRSLPDAKLPLTCTDGTRTWACKEPPPSPRPGRSPTANLRRTTPQPTPPEPPKVQPRRDPALGWSWGFRSRRAAERRAMKECPGSRCKIAMWFRNTCGAIATGRNGGWGVAYHRDRRRAVRMALRFCRNYDQDCKSRQWVCSRGYGAFAIELY